MKTRLDVWLTEQGFFQSRSAARHAIISGRVRLSNEQATKAGQMFDPEVLRPEVDPVAMPYVSMGGFKLKKLMDGSGLKLEGCRVLDVGASTGGFTDCALQHGAASVCAVDGGSSQLHARLKNDARVRWFENLDFRAAGPGQLGEGTFDAVLMDVSFISCTLLMDAVMPWLGPDSVFVLLIKPQFELDARSLNSQGRVRNAALLTKALAKVLDCASGKGLVLKYLTYAPLREAKKNIEFIALFTLRAEAPCHTSPAQVINAALAERSLLEKQKS